MILLETLKDHLKDDWRRRRAEARSRRRFRARERAHIGFGSAMRARSALGDGGMTSTITASVRTCVKESGDKRISVDPCGLADSKMSAPRAWSNGRSRSLSHFGRTLSSDGIKKSCRGEGGRWRQRARNRLLPLDPYSSSTRATCGVLFELVRGRDVNQGYHHQAPRVTGVHARSIGLEPRTA